MIRGFGSILEALAAARGIARRIGSPWAPRDASAAARDITRRIGFRAYARPGIVRAQLGRRLPRNSSRIPKLLLPSPARTFDARPDECTPLHEPPAWMADPGRAGSAARSLRDAPRRARSRLVHGSDLPGLRWSARRRRERLPTITFQGAPDDGSRAPDTAFASARTANVNALESVPGLAFVRFQVDFDLVANGSELTTGSPRPSLEFLRIPYFR